jgi:hypothetical protein
MRAQGYDEAANMSDIHIFLSQIVESMFDIQSNLYQIAGDALLP